MATYEDRGVSPHKSDVKSAIKGADSGLFPGAFCKAIPDVFGNSPDHCLLLHADGAGTKSALAYIHYRRHGDAAIFHGIAQDSLVMNLDDLACVGAFGPFVLSNTIGRNAKLIPGDVLRAIIEGYDNLAKKLKEYGIEIHSCGGETADVGDLVRTIVVDSVLATRMARRDFVDCSRVRPGHEIIGLASDGRAIYESAYNSGVGSNGFTALRHELLTYRYREEFPETYAPDIAGLAYNGACDIDDGLPGTDMTIGEALLSPTRTYAPVLREVLGRYRGYISAVFHNTGGGQTKCMNFGDNILYMKDNLFPPPPVFEFLKRHTNLPSREMFRVFNMGHRVEIVCDPVVRDPIIETAKRFGVGARVIGRTESQKGDVSLVIVTPTQTIEYRRGDVT
ncbi:MAG: AIR synthase related protein [Syntrophorhabdales bacterium]|jgi:phosphoribosylformylglycinamidine cyclo-ligase